MAPLALPQLAPTDVRLLWVNDWYDTPTEAVVEYHGRRCLLRLEDASALDGTRPVRWILYALDAAQLAEHTRWHEDYALHVGTHWCFHDEPHENAVERDDHERHSDRFFAARRNTSPVPIAELEPIAWLDALPLR